MSTAKKVSQDYERKLPESYVRASSWPFFNFYFLFAGLLMSFSGHSCPSIIIICSQSQTWGKGHVSRVLSLLPTAFTVKCMFYNYI